MSAHPVLILTDPPAREGHGLSDPAAVEQLWDEFAELGEYGAHAVPVGTATPEEVAVIVARRLEAGELAI